MDQAEIPPAGAAALLHRCTGGIERGGPGAATGEEGRRGGRARHLAALLVAALLLAWPAAWNGYPLVFADTGTYLGQALVLYLGWDRPPFYSLFLLATHWRLTLWGPVLAQALILAHLLSLSLRVAGRPEPLALVLAALGLAVFTGLPWLVAQLIPDVFTGVVLLGFWLIGFGWPLLSRGERGWVLLLATGAVAVHQSHLPIALGLAALGTLLLSLRRDGAWRGMAAGAARLFAPGLLAALAMVAVNLAGHGRASVSPFGSVFLAARLIADGPALRVLRDRCPEAGWRICASLDRLGTAHNDFLWEPQGVLRGELGGGKAWAAEASAIVAETLRAEPAEVAGRVAGNTLRQMLLLDTGDGLEPWPAEPGPEPLIARYFPQELVWFQESRQQRGLLQGEAQALAPLHRMLAWLGLVVLPMLLLLRRRQIGPAGVALALFVLAGALGNAAITGGLSGPAVRYQARLAWVFVLAPTLLLVVPPRGAPGPRNAAPSRRGQV